MKLTLREAQNIADLYDLGKVKKIKYFPSGWVNYNYSLETTKGKFMVQIVIGEFNNWKKEKMEIKFKVLNHLRKKKFPFEITIPIKNKKGKYLGKVANKNFWVYSFIEGEIVKKITKNHINQISKMVAIYHNSIKNLKIKDKEFLDWGFTHTKYKKLRKIKPTTKIKKLILDNIDLFEDILNDIKELDFNKHMLVTHSDINRTNLLFENGRLKAVLDFDNIQVSPRVNDLAMALTRFRFMGVGWSKKKQDVLLKEYEKINKLTKEEKNLIIPLILKDNIGDFWWLYDGLKKHKHLAYQSLVDKIDEAKKLYKQWKKQDWKRVMN
jgi:Ser/Thr protein kinase RdoA (MazF antagonist)